MEVNQNNDNDFNNSESIIRVLPDKSNEGYNINLMIKKILTSGNYESIAVETDNPLTAKNDRSIIAKSSKKYGFGPMLNHR